MESSWRASDDVGSAVELTGGHRHRRLRSGRTRPRTLLCQPRHSPSTAPSDCSACSMTLDDSALEHTPYPRVFPGRPRTRGFYVAAVLVLAVWAITPLSCVYLLWYALIGRHSLGASAAIHSVLVAYSIIEATFAIYHSRLAKTLQAPTPPPSKPIPSSLFLKVIQSNLSHVPILETSDALEHSAAKQAYASGELNGEEYAAKIKELFKPREYRHVGMIQDEVRESIGLFACEREEREKMLRDQVERGAGPPQEDESAEGILNSDGSPKRLDVGDPRAIEFRERLRTWFNNAPWDALRKENIETWIAWAALNQPLERVKSSSTLRPLLEQTYDLLEARTGTTFLPGNNPNIQILRLTLDPVNIRGRPMILYALASGINWWLRDWVYARMGMGMYEQDGIQYLIRIPPGWTPEAGERDPNQTPVVFFHGLGFGLLQNHLLIKKLLTALPRHPLIVPLQPHITQSIFNKNHLRPFGRKQLVNAMEKICARWGLWTPPDARGRPSGGVILMSHSAGSIPHGWLIKDCPTLAKRSVFVDPVVFCLWEGDVCYNFCYRDPKTALELLLYYFIAAEIGIAHYIQRHFEWSNNNVFFDEIPNAHDPRKFAVFLGGEDMIIDAGRVRQYFERHGAANAVNWDVNAGHGDGLMGDALLKVVNFVGTGSTLGWEGLSASDARMERF